jgi:hypothetical protein
MKELAEMIVVSKRRAGRRKKSLDVTKLDVMKVPAAASPDSAKCVLGTHPPADGQPV